MFREIVFHSQQESLPTHITQALKKADVRITALKRDALETRRSIGGYRTKDRYGIMLEFVSLVHQEMRLVDFIRGEFGLAPKYIHRKKTSR